jgi:O-antigen ligase
MWLENPIFGVGITSFKAAYRSIAESGIVSPFITPDGRILQYTNAHHAHNLVLQLLTCVGICGLIAFSVLFVSTVRMIIRNENDWHKGLMTWPIVFLVVGLTGWNIFDAWYTSLFVFFISLAGIQESEQRFNFHDHPSH